MIKYIVQGGTKLSGSVTISGAKNAAVAILPATLLVSGPCRIENVPDISDVRLLLEILRDMGAEIHRYGRNTLEIDCSRARNATAPIELVRRIRASYYLIGAELGRFGHAHVAMPGGCNFGVRPIDQHIKGFEAMGAMVEQSGGYVCADAPKGGLRGGHIYLDIVSVGATMNILLAAVLCSGMTIIENCAKEPHIVDLANFLNAMGAQISGAGTDVIKVRGVKALHGGCYSIIPDQIEAGTYMAAAAAVGGDVLIENGDISIIAGDSLLQQKIQTVLHTNLGEWFFDWDQGIDFDNLLGKGITEELVRHEILRGLAQVDSTLSITAFTFEADERDRKARVTFKAQTSSGDEVGGEITWD